MELLYVSVDDCINKQWQLYVIRRSALLILTHYKYNSALLFNSHHCRINDYYDTKRST